MSSSRPVLRRCAAAAILVTTGGLAATLTVAPVQAMPSPSSTAPCLGASAAVTNWGGRGDEGMDVTSAQAQAVQRVVKETSTRRSANSLPAIVVIPVRAHIIRGTHKREKGISKNAVRRQIQRLNQGYAGTEAPGVAFGTRYRFRLKSISITKNDRFFHAGPGARGKQMKRQLHRGKKYTLNLYFAKLSGGLLGYSVFPWQYRAHPKLDGVVVDYRSGVGGIAPYDEGDTAVHEVGHWLGLLHTFQGGCAGDSDPANSGDFVVDTAAEGQPQTKCDATADTCADAPGLDPIHNFMDYSYDACMYEFTQGQSQRMDALWAAYRAP